MNWWCNYLARRDSRKKARKNKAEWVPHLPKMSNDEIMLDLLTSDINPGYRGQLEAELETRRERRRTWLIVSTLIFSALSAAFSFWGIFWR